MSIISTASSYSLSTLQSIYSAFNNNLSYSSTQYVDGNGITQTISLVGFLTNPNFSGFNIPAEALQQLLPFIYNGLTANLNRFLTDVSNNQVLNYNLGKIYKFRILVALADGNVLYDSSKTNNTYANFLTKSINENHASRKSFQQAIHSKDGIGYETKWSSSTQTVDTYYAIRYGFSSTGILGVVIFSYSNNF
jgi:hypothetical protein